MEKNSSRAQALEAELKKIWEADSMRSQQQRQILEQLRKNSKAYPVAPFGDTLFNVHLRIGATRPEERARRISERIQQLYADNFFRADSLRVIADEWGHEVVYRKEETILVVSELDAQWYQKDSRTLATEYREKIVAAVEAEKKENSLTNWLRRIGLVVLIIIGAFLLVMGINRLYNILIRWVDRRKPDIWKGLSIGKLRVFSPQSQQSFIRQVIWLARIVTIVIALYLCLPLLFYVFPDTQDITNTLLQWVISPARKLLNGVLDFLPNLFTILVIFLFTRYLVRGLKFLFHEMGSGQVHVAGFHPDFARPTFNIVRFVLYAFMLVLIFPYLPGSGSPAFQGVSVFLGVLLSLGSSSAINNIIAGLVITYMRPFKLGDRVRIGDVSGDVVEKSMLVIKIRTVKNEEITVPNSTVLSGNTINYSVMAEKPGLIVHTTVTIGYDAPWRDVHQVLLKAADKTSLLRKDPAPFVLQTSLDDFYVSYQLNAYTSEASQQSRVYSELHQHIQDCFNEAGIEIMSPHYRAMRDGNTVTIPESFRPGDYRPDAFRVQNDGG
jgi:small-conductance mechanosensitive channel